MSQNPHEPAGPSTISAVSSIVTDGTSQEASGGNRQPQGQPISSTAEPRPFATSFPNRNQYTPPYTPGESHTGSTTFPLGEGAPIESDVEILCPQVQAFEGSAHDTGAGFPQNTTPPGQMDTPCRGKVRDTIMVESAIETQPKDWDARHMHQRRIEKSPSVHGSRSGTHSSSHSLPKDSSPVPETGSRHEYSQPSQLRDVGYTPYRHNDNHQSYYSTDRYPMRGLSPDPVRGAVSIRGRSPSPKSLVDDHEEASNRLDHDVSDTRTNRVRSQSSSSISGIESRRESLSRSQSRDLISTHIHHRRGYTPPRLDTQPKSQWTRPASPVHTADVLHHKENATLPVPRAEVRFSLASRLDFASIKKTSTPIIPHSEAEAPVTRTSPPYRFGKMRSEDYGMDGRPTRRRLQDRIDGNQTGPFGSKFSLRCPYSHRVNGADDCHDKHQPHPGYTSDEWRDVMDFVQRFRHAPPQLTKEGCVYHPAFKPPEGFRPPESSQPRSHSLNPFSIPAAGQGTDRYIPPPTPPIPQQPPMAMPYPQPALMQVPMPNPPFSSGPLPPSYPLRPTHIGASHQNPFDTSGTFDARPALKKRRIGPKGQFGPPSGDYGSQQAQSYQWHPHSIPPPNWSQQPPSSHPPTPMGRPSYTRQAHRPNTFHNQQGQPPFSHPIHRKRPYDQR